MWICGLTTAICPNKSGVFTSYSHDVRVRTGSCALVPLPCVLGVHEECYLVDPASSHMLVSKIKPCMCKYELIQTVKLRMAH